MKRLLSQALTVVIAVCSSAVQAQTENDYQAGVEARRAGHPEEAAQRLRTWLANHPQDADARVQLAYAELALGDLVRAEADFNAVLAAAPDYKDASDGLALIAERRKAQPVAVRPTLAIDGAWSDLNHGAKDWYEASARLTAPVGHTATADLGGSYYRRFGLADVELSGMVSFKPSENLWLRAAGSVTPSADFRPRWGLGGGLDWRLHGGLSATVFTFDARYEYFPLQHVTTLSPGVVQYFAGGHAWVTARGYGIVPQGRAMQLGWMLRGDFEPAERYRVFAGAADGPDTDLGVVTQVTSAFGGVEIPLSERFSLTTSLAHEWRHAGSHRTELRMGLKAGL